MSDAVRAFTPIGNDAFTAYLGRLPENPSEPPPWDLLENHASSRAPGFSYAMSRGVDGPAAPAPR